MSQKTLILKLTWFHQDIHEASCQIIINSFEDTFLGLVGDGESSTIEKTVMEGVAMEDGVP